MIEKQFKFLQLLGSKASWISVSDLSSVIGKSIRTVKTYAHDIMMEYPDLLESSSQGYRIKDKDLLVKILNEYHPALLPQNAEERKKYMLRKLLFDNRECQFDELAYELCISSSTLTNELKTLKTKLDEYHLKIKVRQSKVSIVGSEECKKRYINALIFEDVADSFKDIKQIQTYFPKQDLATIKEIISTVLTEHEFYLDYFSLLNLVLQIALMIDRKNLTNQQIHISNDEWSDIANIQMRDLIKDVTDKLSDRMNVEFSENEVHDLALLIITRVVANSVTSMQVNQLQEFVGSETMSLIQKMQTSLQETYDITMTNEDFTIRFALHLKNLIIRLKNGVVLRNPLADEIKRSYPFIYDVSVFLANVFIQHTGFMLNNDEIAYFALHLGVLIEEQKVTKNEVRALLFCPHYFTVALSLANNLSTKFDGALTIVEIVTDFDKLNNRSHPEYDLLITCSPYNHITVKPTVYVSSFFSNKDMLAVSNVIEHIIANRTKAKIEANLRTMFHKDMFFIDADIKNQMDALSYIGGLLKNAGYVDEDFIDMLYERERISSSAYNNIAMPHPIKMNAKKSVIAVSLHPNPINWNDRSVNIIFLLAISKADRSFYKDMFDFITDVISIEKNLNCLIHAKSFDEFITLLTSCAK